MKKRSLTNALAAMVLAFGTMAGTAIEPSAARADPTAPPPLTDLYGLTQIPTEPAYTQTNTAFDFVITVSTPQVAGQPELDNGGHHIRIVLPSDYYSNPAKRYPVLYLLNSSYPGADPASFWSGFGAVNSTSGMIFVMPDGGPRGWYSNWLNQNSAAGAQNWETFHIGQVIPFIDANLRTLADKQHRGVAGISMGGFGALHYAETYPDLFSQVATLSGDDDLSRNSMDLREAVVASLTEVPVSFAPSPAVGSDDVFGTPYPFSVVYPYSDVLWNNVDPGAHAAALQGMGVSIYVGNGGGGPVPPVSDPHGANIFLEWWLQGAAQRLKANLDAAGVPSHFVDYGDGTGTAWADCYGGHNGLCWSHDLDDLIPRLRQALGAT
ncbi:S-formylglutathione hydrolase FrmB [Catenulispora sp. GAS73]|uniref:alpha/beta hydrolase n=1 Tax=Catenulispora sp. GAS73 TaxID=3156269 RepID=UPI0035148F97